MQAYCYAYYYSMPSSFDFGSAVPCIDLAVQSLGETFQGDDGKYYQADIIGDRECEILGGGVGNFDGLRAIEFSDLSGVTIVDYTGTSIPTINGNVLECTPGVLYYLELSDGSKYYFNACAGSTVYDISDNGNHGTLVTGSDIGFQTFEQGIYSYLDNYGYNKLGNAYIPALESNKAVDVFGTALENAGRVKYPAELWSSCLVTDGSTNYIDTLYMPNENTSLVVKCSFNNISSTVAMGLSDSSDSRYYFGVYLGKWLSGYGTVSGLPEADGIADTEPHTFIKCQRELWVLPFDSDTSTPEKVKSLMEDNTPTVTYTTGSYATEAANLYLGAIHSSGSGTASSFSDATIFEAQLLECDGVNISIVDKWVFSEYGSNYVNSLVGGNIIEVVGSITNIWQLSPYAYPRNNTLGFGRAGDAFIPIELGGSCLVMNGTDNSISINESCGLGYDEDFHYIFGFSLSESTNYHECLFNIQSDTYYGGSMFLYVKYGDIPKFRIRKKVNSSYLTYTLSFPDELPRDGSKISGFVKKEGSIITMGFNGVEVSADFPGEAPAYENDIITIGTSDSGMSSAFLTGKLFYLDIAPSFKSKFSDFSGSTIENMYEDKSAGILSGSLLSAWEISKLAVTYTGTNAGLNGSESEYKDPYVFELIEACNSLAPNFRFSSTESLLWGYDDIEGNIQDLNFMFSDVNTNTPVKDNTTTYSEALTGDCLAKANEYFKTT